MSKFLQSNSRNQKSALKEAKTQERVSGRNSYKPFSSLMIKSFSKASMEKSKESEKKNSRSIVPSYLEKAYKRAMQSLESISSKDKKNSIASIDSDVFKKNNRNMISSQSSNIISMSSEELNDMHMLANRSELMYIEEEQDQEYTTTDRENAGKEPSCQCETEDGKYDSDRQFAKTYCYKGFDEHQSDPDNEVLLSSPQSRVKGNQNSRLMFNH
jgi:hypothetical protein